MASAYASSDLIISRSGALTCSEITICNKPSILIPLPFSAGNHQLKNAEALNRAGACEILLEKELIDYNSIHKIIQILRNKKKLELMQKNCKKISKPEAAMKIVDQIMMLIPNFILSITKTYTTKFRSRSFIRSLNKRFKASD